MSSSIPSPPLSIISQILLLTILISFKSISPVSSQEKASPAFFIFGDSTVDTGNNNYLDTVAELKGNVPPYGQNAFSGDPTGRFSNGRLILDFIAEYAKLPEIPPFLQPSARFINGVNFGSGGAGVLPETQQGFVIDLQTQLKQFDNVTSSISAELGVAEARELIANAIYCISFGSNDYFSYFSNPKVQEAFTPEDFVGMVIGNLSVAIQELYEKGARKFAVLSICSLGCLPALRAANPKADGSCYEELNALASAHNNALYAVLISFHRILKGFKYAFSLEFYNWFLGLIHNPSQFGLKDATSACCGSGPYGGVLSCGGNKEVKDYEVCKTPEEFVWWDSFHGTERFAEIIAEILWDDPMVGPYTMKELVFDHDKLSIADSVDAEAAAEGYPM